MTQQTATSKKFSVISTPVLVAIGEEDKPYLSKLSPSFKGVAVKVFAGGLSTLAELCVKLQGAGIKHVATTRVDILKKLLPDDAARTAKIDNYAGSILPYMGIEFLILHPLKQLVTVPYGEFLAKRYISKIVSPQNWLPEGEFEWKICNTPEDALEAETWLKSCDLIGMDIETVRWNTAIDCVGFCGKDLKSGKAKAFVFPMNSMEQVQWVRKLCALPVPKVMQNGKYDCNYLMRYGAPPVAYYFDTANMLHAWYSELPKDLGSVAAFFIRNSVYWKDMAKTNDKHDYYKYNALDTWNTVEAAVAWFHEAPDWAKRNYVDEFMCVPPDIMCELRGLKRDQAALAREAAKSEEVQVKLLKSLQTMTGHADFNPSSPKQVLQLLKVLGYKKALSSDEKTLQEARLAHPLLERFIDKILEYRGERKLSSTYLKTGAESTDFKGRVLYALNPHGTDTGRHASKSHHFWCGLQIQNIPSGSGVKSTIIADEDFTIWEADYGQAEDRGVAYCSGDKSLLKIFDSDVDSHSYKAAMFFGIPYEEIYDEANKKVLNNEIRQLGKRINHGANYNMGPKVLLQTMGTAAVRKAQRLLGLNPTLSPLDVCKHLLFLYEKAFPTVKSDYYRAIKKEIKVTNKMVGPTGWTRWCFGDPMSSKPALNAYVAHKTQSLNAMVLNKAFVKVFLELGFHPDFKLCAQIHDSLLFQVRKGAEHLAYKVKELMTFPVPVTDCFGETREMTVPVDLKNCGRAWDGAK